MGLDSPITIGLVLAIVAAVGGQVVLYVRTMTRLETESRAFRERFDAHAGRLEVEVSGVRVELNGLRADLQATILDTARQAVKLETVAGHTQEMRGRLRDLEQIKRWGRSESSGTRGGAAEEA